MNTIDLLLFDILGTLMPIGSLLLSLVLVVATVQTVRNQPATATATAAAVAEAKQTPVFAAPQADAATHRVLEIPRAARGRISTAMRATHHSHSHPHTHTHSHPDTGTSPPVPLRSRAA